MPFRAGLCQKPLGALAVANCQNKSNTQSAMCKTICGGFVHVLTPQIAVFPSYAFAKFHIIWPPPTLIISWICHDLTTFSLPNKNSQPRTHTFGETRLRMWTHVKIVKLLNLRFALYIPTLCSPIVIGPPVGALRNCKVKTPSLFFANVKFS